MRFTRRGYHRLVAENGAFISQHTDLNEAYERAYRDAQARIDGVYKYRIIPAEIELEVSTLSRVVSDPDNTPPSVPQAVTATAQSQSVIRVTWNASTDTGGSGLSGYRVYRSSTSGGTYVQIGSDLSVASLTYDDTGLSAGQTWHYKVAAFDGNSNVSAQSSSASATTTTGSAGSYTATHYVAPFASVPGSTSDLDPQSATSYTNATNSSAPCTLECALRNATAGHRIRLAPGVYIGTTSFDAGNPNGANSPTFFPRNSGTSGNPIIFFAQHPAATNIGSTSLYSEIRRPQATHPGTDFNAALGTFARNYVIFDGLYANEAVTRSGASEGLFKLEGTGVEFRRLLISRVGLTDYNTWVGASGYNGNAIYVSATLNARVTDCAIIGDSPASLTNQNDSAIETYNSENLVVEYCTITGAGRGIFVKTEKPALLPWVQRNVHVRYNKINSYAGIQVQTSQSTFVYRNEIVAGNGPGLRWGSTAENIDCQMQWYSNTIVQSAASASNGALVIQGSVRMAAGTEIKDNLVVTQGSGNGYLFALEGSWGSAPYDDLSSADRFNYNVYHDRDGTPRWTDGAVFTTFASWQTNCAADFDADAYGREVEQDSQYGTVTFVDYAGGNYRLTSNGQVALTGSSTGGPVGCWVTGSEEIGVRASPTY